MPDNDPTYDATLSEAEMTGRVIYSLLRPAVRLARKFGISLRDIGKWIEMAYFHELRRDGKTLTDIASLLEISRRKSANLSRMLKENFFAPEREQELARRIEFMVWAEPMSRARIAQALSDVAEHRVEDALGHLVEEGRIVKQQGRTPIYEIARGESRLVDDTWLAKIDGLNNLLETVTDAVYARFFEGDEKAMARNLEMRVRAEDLPKLRKLYEDTIWPELEALDSDAKNDPTAIAMGVAIGWAPRDFLANRIDRDDR